MHESKTRYQKYRVMVTRKDVETYFRVHGTINIDNDIVNINGFATLINIMINELPFQFGKVDYDFYCDNANLTNLKGCPHTVGNNFNCSHNELTSLEGGPHTVGEQYYCFNNTNLISLTGLPDTVGGEFRIDWNKNLPMLQLVKLNNVTIYNRASLTEIMGKYCGQKPLRQAIIQCQRELIDAGFKENARL